MKIEFESTKEREVFIAECCCTTFLCRFVQQKLHGAPDALTKAPMNNALICLRACGFTEDTIRKVLAATDFSSAMKLLGLTRYTFAESLGEPN